MLSCSSQKDYITDSDYSFQGRFKKYKTFEFMTMTDSDELEISQMLEKSIGSKLNAQGYRFSPRRPDLYIGYKIYQSDFKLTGYNQPQLESYVYEDWPNRLLTEDDEYIEPAPVDKPDTEYRDNKLRMQEGTLLITFYDRKRDRTVWTGYASGVFAKNNDVERSLKIATNKIFKEFRLIADGYVN